MISVKNISKIAVFTVWVIVAYVLTTLWLDYLALPDVMFSYSTDECVQVMNYVEGENYSCENFPAKFHHVWVK